MELNFIVLEVGLLQNNTCAIAQCQLLITKYLILLLANNLTSLREFLLIEQWLLLYVVNVWFNLLSTYSIDCLCHLSLCWVGSTRLLLCKDISYEVTILIRDEFLCILIDNVNVQCRHLNQLLHNLIIVLLAWNWFVSKIVITELIAILSVLHLVTVDVS